MILCPPPPHIHTPQGLLDRLLAEVKSGGPGGYGVRRGAAYGVSGVVKGLGIASLKVGGVSCRGGGWVGGGGREGCTCACVLR